MCICIWVDWNILLFNYKKYLYVIYRFNLCTDKMHALTIPTGLSGITALGVYSPVDVETDTFLGQSITLNVHVLYLKCPKLIEFFLLFLCISVPMCT